MQSEWTVEQWKFIEWLASPRFTRTPPTQEMVAAQLGVDDSTLWRWKKLDGFQEEVNKIARAGLVAALPTIYGALIREAEAGDYQCIKLAFEMSKEFVPTQKNVNQSDVKGEYILRFVEEETQTDEGE